MSVLPRRGSDLDLLISRTDGVVKLYTNRAVDADVAATSGAVGEDRSASADAAFGDIDGCVPPPHPNYGLPPSRLSALRAAMVTWICSLQTRTATITCTLTRTSSATRV